MRKLMMLAALLAVALLAASPALAQDEPKVVADAKAKTATAGGAKAEANCEPDQMIEAKAGGVVAKAPCKPAPPPPPKAAPAPPPPKAAPAPPPPKAAPAPPPPKAAPPPPPPKAAPAPAPKMKALPPTGGSSTASLFALGAGALLVGGGLVARRFIR